MKSRKYKDVKDEELVRLFVETQRNPYFEELYDRYADKIYRKCYSFVKDTARAEDFTHDIFLKLATKLGTFKETARFSTWVYSITYNYCMDQLRMAKKRSEIALEDNFDVVEDTSEAELLSIQTDSLRKSMEHLSTDEKAILLMKYQDDFSIKEIADALDVTESAVKMRLMRTREKVRKIYLEHFAFLLIIILKLIDFLRNHGG